MNNPWQSFIRQPWSALFGLSAIALAIGLLLDVAVGLALALIPSLRTVVALVLGFGLLIVLGVGLGLGALTVALGERGVGPAVRLNAGSLWALVGCLMLEIALVSALPLPISFIGLSEWQVVGIVVGTFWKGRPYWK